jgi:hypothetical protein
MKSLQCWGIVATVALCLVGGQKALAQPQRMAIPRVSGLKLAAAPKPGVGKVPAAAGSTKRVQSICLNEERPTPTPSDNFKYIMAGSDKGRVTIGTKAYTLREAIEKGLISIRGTGSYKEIEFQNHTNEEVQIDTDSPLIVGGHKGDHIADIPNPAEFLKKLAHDTKPKELKDLQDEVWDALDDRQAERVKGLLGGATTAEQDRRKYRGDNELLGLLDKEGQRTAAVIRLHEGYRVYKLTADGKSVDYAHFRLDRDATGALKAESKEVLALIQNAEFARAAAASDHESLFLAVGVAADRTSPTAFRVGNAPAVEVPSDAARTFFAPVEKGDKEVNPADLVPEQIAKQIADSKAKRVIVWRSAYLRSDAPAGLKDWGQVVERLQARFPDKEFALDGDSEASREKMLAQPEVKGGADLAVVNDEKSLPRGYEDMITKLKGRFEKANVRVFAPDEKPGAGADNILVVSGLKNDDFQDVVDDLLDQGHLKGKVVVFFACGEGQEDGYNSQLLADPEGPAAILYYTERIDPEAVRRVLTRLSKMIDEKTEKARIQTLINRAVDLEVEKSKKDAEPADFQKKLLQLKQLVLQLSRLDPPARPAVARA